MNQLNVIFQKDEIKYVTIYRTIKKLITTGKIKANEKLPSKRDLAENLNVSNNTIMNAYNLLLNEGYIYSKEKSGYFASSNRYIISTNKELEFQEEKQPHRSFKYDFTSENIESSLFPFYTFRKVSLDLLNDDPNIWLTRSPYQGDNHLRKNIAKYLYENKGMDVTSKNIVIVSSLEESLSITSTLIKIEKVGLEDPIFPKVNNYYINKASIDYLPIDDQGIILSPNNEYDLIYVTPYNQYPSGVKMSTSRKIELINYSTKYIFEDDFDCDLISQSKIMSTLYSLNKNKVIYHGSFSHTLCPGLRLSYLVLPDSLLLRYQEIYSSQSSKISSLDQSILSKFLEDGHYYRHITKLRKSLNEKKNQIRKELQNYNVEFVEKELSFFIKIDKNKEERIKQNLYDNSIKINTLDKYQINKKDSQLILCYTNIQKEDIPESIKLIKTIIA